MPENDAELARLRAADPIDRASLPSASDPEARALFERITMNEPHISTTRPARTPRVLLGAAAVALVVLAAGVVMVSDRDGSSVDVATSPTTRDAGDEPITPGGSTGSCVELYDLDTIVNRQFAFDGTVANVDGDDVIFDVNHWFKGGSGAQTTLAGAASLGGLTSAGATVSLEPGTRLLVAGDGGFAWSCGFTQTYDAGVAKQWSEVLAG